MPKVDDPKLKMEIFESIHRAFYLKDMKYANQLVYDDPQVPRTMNNASLEGGVQDLSERNIQVLEKLPLYCPPVFIRSDELTGFYVEAAQDIPALTLICEYIG